LAPLIPTPGAEELPAQVQPRGLGQRRRVVGQARVHAVHLAQEDLPDLGPVTVDGGDQDVRRAIMPELDDQLGQVGLERLDPLRGERLVQPDLVGDHGLDLHGLGRAGRPDEPGDELVGLGGVPRPVHGAAAGADLGLQLLQVPVQPGHGPLLDGLPGVPQLLPVGDLGHDRRALGADGPGGAAQVGAQLAVAQRPPRRGRERLGRAQVADPARRLRQAQERHRSP
jgi:hypothetical protein